MISWPGAVGECWKFGGSVTRSPKQRWPGWIRSSSLGLRGLLVFFFFCVRRTITGGGSVDIRAKGKGGA